MTTMNRRSLLNAGLGVSAAALGGPLLSACGGSNDGGGAGKAGEAGATPVYEAAKGPKPDIVGDGQIPDTYFAYPANPVQSVTEKAGDGKPINILTQTFAPVTSQPPRNTAWQNLNDKIGSELKIQQISAGEYASKFSTAVAGDQLPDMFFIAEVADMPDLVEATCLDLSEHLAGDAIKQYPNLAAIPSDCWEAGRFGGRLYGIPSPAAPCRPVCSIAAMTCSRKRASRPTGNPSRNSSTSPRRSTTRAVVVGPAPSCRAST